MSIRVSLYATEENMRPKEASGVRVERIVHAFQGCRGA